VAPIPPLPRPAGAALRDLTLNEDFDSLGQAPPAARHDDDQPVLGNFGREYLNQRPK